MPDKYPRTLIISTYPLHPSFAAGIAMRSFFLGWDRDRLAQIYAPFLSSGSPDFELCHDYRRLHWNGRVERVLPPDNACPNPPGTRKPSAVRRAIDVFKHIRFVQRMGTPLRNYWLGRPRYARGLQDEIESMRPQVVFAFFNNLPVTRATTIACRNLGIPLCMYIGDDFVRGFGRAESASRKRSSAEYWLKQAVDHASGQMAVGPHMAQEYSRRYGGDWQWFPALPEAGDYDPSPRGDAEEGPIRIVYAGNLTFNRWEMLRRLGLALKQLGGEGITARLVIYSSPAQVELYGDKLDIPPVVDLQGWVPPEQLPQIFHDSDVLVHCESFADKEVSNSIKWSLSTKITQYMMAGRCVLALGPPELASIKFVKESDAGIVIETQDPQTILRTLRDSLGDRERLIRLGQVGRGRAMELFEGRTQREKFRRAIVSTIDKYHARYERQPRMSKAG